MKLAIVTTHPIQYNAPFFKLVASKPGVQLKVFYGWRGATELVDDPGFDRKIQWDIDLLSGYESAFVQNTAQSPGTHHFHGIDCPSMNREIADWNPQVLLVYGWSWHANLKAMRHFGKRIPVLFRGDSTLLDKTTWIKSFLRACYLRNIYRNVRVALYTGTNNRKYFEAMGLKGRKLEFAPHAIDNDRFMIRDSENKRMAMEWRRSNGIEESKIVLLFVGKFEAKKDPGILIRAMEESSLLSRNCVTVFCGSGQLEQDLRQHTRAEIRFLGFRNQNEMPWVYRVGDLLILPSIGPNETWGLTLNEAMACGRAVAASDKVGGAIDLIDEMSNGFIFQAGKLSDLVEKLETMVSVGGRPLLAQWGNSSRDTIQEWSFDRQWNGLFSAMERNCDIQHS